MNCKDLMSERLPEYIQKLLRIIGKYGDEAGFSVFIVGGFVRDLLLDRNNLDVDIVVEGDGIGFARTFAEKQKGKAKCHERFGTAVVSLPDGFKIDVATARTEIYAHPGALPTVEFGSIKEDLRRRDFTINAMALNLSDDGYGDLVDFYGGMSDLQSGFIRVIHDLSFSDDPTRMFRAIRFEQRYGFSIEPHTEALLREAVERNFLNTITPQRLRNEILLILREDDLVAVLKRMDHFGILGYIHPRISISDELANLFDRSKKVLDWWESTTGKLADRVLLNFMTLVDQLDEYEVESVSSHLVLTKSYTEALILSKKNIFTGLKSPSRIYEALKGLPLEVLLFGIAKSESEDVKESIYLYLTKLRHIKPLINGNDLRRLGYPESPLYRHILSETFSAQLDGIIQNKDQAIHFVTTNFQLNHRNPYPHNEENLWI